MPEASWRRGWGSLPATPVHPPRRSSKRWWISGATRPLHVEWSVNEKVALEVAAGASWTGTRAVATMKHVGLNVAADPFMTLAYLGVGAGLLVICADDPFCHSSQNEQDSRRYAQFASIPCLDPSDPQEAKDMAIYGFELSEKFNIPVMLRPTTRVSHARADVEAGTVPPDRARRGQFVKNPARRVALPGHARALHTELIAKQAAIEEALESCSLEQAHSARERGSHRLGHRRTVCRGGHFGPGPGCLTASHRYLSCALEDDLQHAGACHTGPGGGGAGAGSGRAGGEAGQDRSIRRGDPGKGRSISQRGRARLPGGEERPGPHAGHCSKGRPARTLPRRDPAAPAAGDSVRAAATAPPTMP